VPLKTLLNATKLFNKYEVHTETLQVLS